MLSWLYDWIFQPTFKGSRTQAWREIARRAREEEAAAKRLRLMARREAEG